MNLKRLLSDSELRIKIKLEEADSGEFTGAIEGIYDLYERARKKFPRGLLKISCYGGEKYELSCWKNGGWRNLELNGG
jgi:hypothetical protein